MMNWIIRVLWSLHTCGFNLLPGYCISFSICLYIQSWETEEKKHTHDNNNSWLICSQCGVCSLPHFLSCVNDVGQTDTLLANRNWCEFYDACVRLDLHLYQFLCGLLTRVTDFPLSIQLWIRFRINPNRKQSIIKDNDIVSILRIEIEFI